MVGNAIWSLECALDVLEIHKQVICGPARHIYNRLPQ